MSADLSHKLKLKYTNDAAAFKQTNGGYQFPFVCLDPTPGGRNLGRIEWHVELVRGRKRQGRHAIIAVLIWASQTSDVRYQGITFVLPADTAAIGGDFLKHLWHSAFCAEHGNVVMSAYPSNHHTALVIGSCYSSIYTKVHFTPEAR